MEGFAENKHFNIIVLDGDTSPHAWEIEYVKGLPSTLTLHEMEVELMQQSSARPSKIPDLPILNMLRGTRWLLLAILDLFTDGVPLDDGMTGSVLAEDFREVSDKSITLLHIVHLKSVGQARP